jgi:hypothetical protein
MAFSILQTTDGGYAVGGITNSFGAGDYDMYVLKLNSFGSIQWSRTMGGAGYEFATSMAQTTNGDLVLSSTSNSFTGGFCMMKLNSSGTLQWSGLVYTDNDDVTGISKTSDGGFAFTGNASYYAHDVYVAKINASNNLQWARIIGGTNVDAGYTIIQSNDGGIIVAGITFSFGAGLNDMYIVKLDSSGTLQWNRAIGGAGYDYANSIIKTTDGGFALAGYTESFGSGSADMYIVKLNASGMLQWSRTAGGTSLDYASSIIQTIDGGYAVTGATRSFGSGSADFYIVKLDAFGTIQWSRTIGGTGNDYAYSMVQTTDVGYLLAGHTTSFGSGNIDMYIVKLDAGGNTCGNSTSPVSIFTNPTSAVNTPVPTVTNVNAGVTNSTPSTGSGGTMTAMCLVGIEPVSNEIPEVFSLMQNYPNPFNPVTTIKYGIPKTSNVILRIYDVLGNEVRTLINEKKSPGVYSESFNSENLSSGVYFYKIEAGDFTDVKKMLLVK